MRKTSLFNTFREPARNPKRKVILKTASLVDERVSSPTRHPAEDKPVHWNPKRRGLPRATSEVVSFPLEDHLEVVLEPVCAEGESENPPPADGPELGVFDEEGLSDSDIDIDVTPELKEQVQILRSLALDAEPVSGTLRQADNSTSAKDGQNSGYVPLQDQFPDIRIAWQVPDKTEVSLTKFQLALAIWTDSANISRTDYQGLVELVKMSEPEDWDSIPNNIDTLKYRYERMIPSPTLYEHSVPVKLEKLPTGHPGIESAFFYDIVDIARMILTDSSGTNDLHFGMAELVDSPSEHWHGLAWAEGIRACSGDFGRYPASGDVIFPGDLLVFGELSNPKYGRVRAVWRDRRKGNLTEGQVLFGIERICWHGDLPINMRSLLIDPAPLPNEFVLIEEMQLVPESDILQPVRGKVMFDHDFKDGQELAAESAIEQQRKGKLANAAEQRRRKRGGPSKAYRPRAPAPIVTPNLVDENICAVRRIIGPAGARPFKLSHPIRGQLEIETYGREYIINNFSRDRKVVCIPFTTFVDGFGLYRNMYRSLTGIYATPAGLSHRQRTRLENVYPVTLGPHGSSLRDMFHILAKSWKPLEGGFEIEIRPGEVIWLCAFSIAYCGDMPQQNDCCGVKRQNAIRGCRSCEILSENYGDLDWDIIKSGRYHYEMLKFRTAAKSQLALNFKGLSRDGPLINILSPAIDLCRSTPADAPHADLSGIARLLQELLFNGVLVSAEEKAQYTSYFRTLPLPPGWTRVQSPLKHRQSWDLSEQTRALVVSAMVLRCWLDDSKVNVLTLAAIRNEFRNEILSFGDMRQGYHVITYVFGRMAYAYTLVSASSLTKADQKHMQMAVTSARKLFVRLVRAVSIAVKAREAPLGRMQRSGSVASTANGSDASAANASVISGEDNICADASEDSRKKLTSETFKAWMNRPNVHVGLHYGAIAEQHATVWNANVLVGENYHRIFKRQVSYTNKHKPEQTLLRREMRHKTLRAICMSDAYSERFPVLTEMIQFLRSGCPTLMEHFLPPSAHRFMEPEEEQIHIDKEYRCTHINARVTQKLPREYVKRIGLRLRTHEQLEEGPDFLQQLRRAYELHYHRPNYYPQDQVLRYFERATFVDPNIEKRMGYTVGTFVVPCLLPEPPIMKVRAIFTHQVSGHERIFVLVQPYVVLAKKDAVTGLRVIRPTAGQTIIGLPAISSHRPYVVPVPARISIQLQHESSKELCWWCDWNVQYA